MKPIYTLAFLLLVAVLPLRAEDPPELEEWFRITGNFNGAIGRVFSYLPNFDVANSGKNATAVRVTPRMPTWYNRYQGDTMDQFDWEYTIRDMRKADLNGNSVDEYITRIGRIHHGIANGVPPEKEFLDYSNSFASVVPFDFHDVDNDGYTDAIANSSYSSPTRLMKILWGGPDLTKLKISEIFRRRQDKFNESLAAVLPIKVEGKLRIVTRSYEESGFQQAKWISYVLRELTPIHEADTVRFDITTLDSISDADKRPTHFYGLFAGAVVQSQANEPVLFMAPLLAEQNSSLEVYDVSNGQFTPVRTFFPWQTVVYPHALRGSINGDGYIDYFLSVIGKVALYAGGKGLEIDTTPIAYFPDQCEIGEGIVIDAIGDVTGDSIGDIALSYNNDLGCFVILKGIANRIVDVPEPGISAHRPFDMQQNYPNPVGSDRRTTIPFTNEKPQHLALALYALDGRFIGEIFSGYVPAGEQEVQIDLTRYNLSSGMYVLRLGNGECTRERGFLIE